MVQRRLPKVGGWFPGRVQLSLFIRDYLSDGQESWSYEIHQAYKKAIEAIPRHRGQSKRKVISYHGFLNYMYMLRQLGLIEYLRTTTGEIDTEEAKDKGGGPAPHLAPKHFIQANMGRINDPAWQNPHKALYG
jgi:hypothetical protein